MEAIRVALVSTWIISPGLQQMSTCLIREKKGNSSVMYQCIAVETDFLPLSTTIHGTGKYLKELDSLLQGQHFSGYFVSALISAS